MNTYILFWNPAISDYPMKNYCREYLRNVGNVLTWELREHEIAEPGDRVFWIRCGEGKTGILMAGSIYESPFEDAHWKNPGEKTSYVPFLVEYAVDPEEAPMITTEMLQKEMPDFDWNGGHSGRLLDPVYAGKLEMMWAKYVLEHADLFEQKTIAACDEPMLEKYQPANAIIQDYLLRQRLGSCEICGYNYGEVFGEDVDQSCEFEFLYHDGKVCANVEDNFHAFCPSCKEVIGFADDLRQVEERLGRKLDVEQELQRGTLCGGIMYTRFDSVEKDDI